MLAVFATFLIVATALFAYSASRPATAIAAEGLTVSFTAAHKPYDQTDTATISDCAIVAGILDDDDVTCEATGAGTFASPAAGTHEVTADSGDFTLGGDDAAGYEITAAEISEEYAGLTFKDILIRIEEKAAIPFQVSLIDKAEELIDRRLKAEVVADG